MDSAQAKQQIVERVKQSENILITVSKNPSVDQLAACIGLTLLLNKIGKSATAVFSGKVPSTIEFLQPDKTLEPNTDSLQDFIISLDKSKADKLRYKVEDQVVRIFITPYRTSIGQKDLVFSQGDFNVEVVMALGIKDRAQIDDAIMTHGRILHDATVISMNAGQGQAPDIGQINWQDPAASSLSEMLLSISEAFGAGLIDNQIATAFLTGIVAETERFSNDKTSPKVMTMSAQLMAAGANQQLIVSKLEPEPPPPAPPPPVPPKPKEPPSTPPKPRAPKPKPQPKPDGNIKIDHAKKQSEEVEIAPNEIRIDEEGNLKTAQELKLELEKRAEDVINNASSSLLPLQAGAPIPMPEPPKPPEPPIPPMPTPPAPPPPPPPIPTPPVPAVQAPVEGEGHHFIDPMGKNPTLAGAFSSSTESSSSESDSSLPVDPINDVPEDEIHEAMHDHTKSIAPPTLSHQSHPSPADLSAIPTAPPPPPESTIAPEVDGARSAVAQALSGAPFDPGYGPPVQSLNAAPAIDLNPQQVSTPSPTSPTHPTPSLNLPTNGAGVSNSLPPPPPMPPPIAPLAT